eukprot:Tbor_TRINITY_DN3539_c0_g1::TRINITY_DN3539_c0_g1_i1::g.2947::m.2947
MLRITFHAGTRTPLGPSTSILSTVLFAPSIISPIRSAATASNTNTKTNTFLGLQHKAAARLRGLLKDAKKNATNEEATAAGLDIPIPSVNNNKRPHQHDRLTREIQHVKRVYDELMVLVSWASTQRLLRESQIPTTESIMKQISKKPTTDDDTKGTQNNKKGENSENEQESETSRIMTNIAHIVQVTAFSPSTMAPGNEYHIHDRNCPVVSNQVPLTAMWTLGEGRGGDSCTHCLRRRVHYLANEHFCFSMAWNSMLKGSMEGMDWESMRDSSDLKDIIVESFGSVDKMKERITEFAKNRRVGGFTWLVFNPNYVTKQKNNSDTTNNESEGNKPAANSTPTVKIGRLEVVNLPGNMIPNVLGMWPISCFNLTNYAITEVFQDVELERKQHPLRLAPGTTRESSASYSYPPWSRAARNLTAATISQSVPVLDLSYRDNNSLICSTSAGSIGSNTGDITLSALRARAIASQLSCWNPLTAYGQIVEAICMFRSKAYTDAVNSRREAHIASAQAAVLKRYENVSVEGVFKHNRMKGEAKAEGKEESEEEQERKKQENEKDAVSGDSSIDNSKLINKMGTMGMPMDEQKGDKHHRNMTTSSHEQSSQITAPATEKTIPSEAQESPTDADSNNMEIDNRGVSAFDDTLATAPSQDDQPSSVEITQNDISMSDGQRESTTQESTSSEAGDEVVEQGVCEDTTTRYYTRANGICSYHFANGTVTEVYPDGRQVTMMEGSTTTTYPDGSTHCLYSNGATIEVRSDGTRYVNGELSLE